MTADISAVAETIKEMTAADFYQIKIVADAQPSIADSKLGGVAYWTPEKDYPVDERGHKMFLVAQINFEQFNFEPPLPSKGLLQFFISDNDLMGADYDDPIAQKNFRVVYHENIDSSVTAETLRELGLPSAAQGECMPVYGEYKISFSKGVTNISMHDFRFDKIYQQVANGKELSDEEYQALRDELDPYFPAHQILGYPYFTQEDPRYNEKFADYDTLLLQIDSEGEYVLWGDVGVGNFFMRRQDLIDKNFDNVLYNWDCC